MFHSELLGYLHIQHSFLFSKKKKIEASWSQNKKINSGTGEL